LNVWLRGDNKKADGVGKGRGQERGGRKDISLQGSRKRASWVSRIRKKDVWKEVTGVTAKGLSARITRTQYGVHHVTEKRFGFGRGGSEGLGDKFMTGQWK